MLVTMIPTRGNSSPSCHSTLAATQNHPRGEKYGLSHHWQLRWYAIVFQASTTSPMAVKLSFVPSGALSPRSMALTFFGATQGPGTRPVLPAPIPYSRIVMQNAKTENALKNFAGVSGNHQDRNRVARRTSPPGASIMLPRRASCARNSLY